MADKKVAEIIVESLYNAGVKYVLGIPGAKIDAIFNTLLDHPNIKLIVCRHEQNAAFIAAAIGRITGVPGVVVVTSGPGAGNLATGLVTATTEGDPIIAIVGSVPRVQSAKHTHQSMKALEILAPTTKIALDIQVEDQAAEMILSAFRTALLSPRGGTVIQLPNDIAAGTSKVGAFPPHAFRPPLYGRAPLAITRQVAKAIDAAKLPVLFLGMRASSPMVVEAVRDFLRKHPIAIVETFQAAGAVPQDLASSVFFGRVGLFHNQVGDRILAAADLVITVGYDPVEYDATFWNPHGNVNIVHIDTVPCDYGAYYQPKVEVMGSISENIHALEETVTHVTDPLSNKHCQSLIRGLSAWSKAYEAPISGPIQPLHFVYELQRRVGKDTTIACDMGTIYIYMMRYFKSYEARRLLCSNGQQTLGVGMPWAIGASLVQEPPCSEKVISISGDGGFMFSSQELTTAVQQKCNITHFIWNSGTYNMVEFQEELKYGRSAGIEIGGVDFEKYAAPFGARGFKVVDASQLISVMDEALRYDGVALVDIKIDYTHAIDLAAHLIKDSIN